MQLLTSPVNEKPCARAKSDEQGQLSTANTRIQPAFAGSYRTVAIPFGSRVAGLENTLWSRMDLSGIDSLKVPTFEQTIKHRVYGCIV